MHLMRYCLLLFSIVLFAGCPSGPSAADCDYEIFRVKAEVVNIAKITEPGPKEGQYEILMEFSGSSLGDRQFPLADLIEMETDTNFMKANAMYVGNKYYVDISERVAGTCDSLHISFDYQFRSGQEQ